MGIIVYPNRNGTSNNVSYPGYSVGLTYDTVNTEFTFTGTNKIALPITEMFGEFTFCTWIQTSTTDRNQVILSKSSFFATSQTDFPISLVVNSSGDLTLSLDEGNDFSSGMVVSILANLNDGIPHHVGIAVSNLSNSNLVKTYIDGIEVDSRAIGFNLATGSREWTIGAYSHYHSVTADSRNFIGTMKRTFFLPNIYDGNFIIQQSS